MLYDKRIFQVKDDMRIGLRSADPADAAALLTLKTALDKDSYYNDLNPEEHALTIAEQAEEIRLFAQSSNRLLLLAFEQEDLIGAASISPLSPNAKASHRAMYHGAILKHYWGYGIGTILTTELFKQAKAMSYEQYEVAVFADHHRAIEMYQTLGFAEWGRIPHAFRIGNDTVDMLYMGKNV